MSKYLKACTTASDLLLANKLRTIKNHISHYPILDEMLGFQYHLNGEVYKFHDSIKSKKYKSEISVHQLFHYNTQSLQSALNDIECDKIHQAAVNIRTVYESIPKMYYISLFPKKIEFIKVYEHITGMPLEKALKEIKGEVCIKDLDGKELHITTEDELGEFRKKYNFHGFVKKIYTKKRQEFIYKSYDKFSNSTHPNIIRNGTSTSYNFINTEFFFELLKGLSYFNIHAYLEGSAELLLKNGIHREILDFLNEKGKQLGSFIEAVYFFPDNKDLKRELKTEFKKE